MFLSRSKIYFRVLFKSDCVEKLFRLGLHYEDLFETNINSINGAN